jgi:hypothetical protein
MTALTKSRLTELLERVERASGEDNDLDALIGIHLAGFKPTVRLGHELLGNERVVPANCPRYTASLDAALALVDRVLPGWCKSAVDLRPEPCEGYVWERGHVGNIQGKAPTPALAVLAAMLRALGDGHASCPS